LKQSEKTNHCCFISTSRGKKTQLLLSRDRVNAVLQYDVEVRNAELQNVKKMNENAEFI
jgi:hypothetical protein